MISKFELVKDYYDRGLWNESRVEKAIGKWITEEEAAEILTPVVQEETFSFDDLIEDVEAPYIQPSDDPGYYVVETPGENESNGEEENEPEYYVPTDPDYDPSVDPDDQYEEYVEPENPEEDTGYAVEGFAEEGLN